MGTTKFGNPQPALLVMTIAVLLADSSSVSNSADSSSTDSLDNRSDVFYDNSGQ